MGKQAKVVNLWRKRSQEAADDNKNVPNYKRVGGARPLAGLCCVECSDKSFERLEQPRRGACGCMVHLTNVISCARCAITSGDGRRCRSCGKSVEHLIKEDLELERQEAKARIAAARRPIGKKKR